MPDGFLLSAISAPKVEYRAKYVGEQATQLGV